MSRKPSLHLRYAARGAWSRACQSSLDWLTAGEQGELACFRDAGRRAQWLEGRWLAKQLLQQTGAAARFDELEILTRDARGLGSRPRVRIAGRDAACSLSIAHTSTGVLVGLAHSPDCSIGVDLAGTAPTDAGFRELWFSAAEQAWLAAEPSRRTPMLWALKEAIYKACNQGEPWSPRQIEILPSGGDRFDCTYAGRRLQTLRIEVRAFGPQVGAIVCVPRSAGIPQRAQRTQRKKDGEDFVGKHEFGNEMIEKNLDGAGRTFLSPPHKISVSSALSVVF